MRALFSVSFLSVASEKVPGSQVVVCTYKHTTKSDLMICVSLLASFKITLLPHYLQIMQCTVGVRSEESKEFIANNTLLYL